MVHNNQLQLKFNSFDLKFLTFQQEHLLRVQMIDLYFLKNYFYYKLLFASQVPFITFLWASLIKLMGDWKFEIMFRFASFHSEWVKITLYKL